MAAPRQSVSQRHAEWAGILRPDGPFIAIPALTAGFPQYLDEVPRDIRDKLRLAWAEVRESPDTLTPSWCELVVAELLGYSPQVLIEGASLPDDLAVVTGMRPDAIATGPDSSGGRTERLLIYRRPFDENLTKATKQQVSPAEQAANLCRSRGVPLALLTNGAHWVLVHARPNESTTTAVFDADYWPDVPDLLRAFYSLLRAPFLVSGRLAELFSTSAEAQAEVTSTLGDQVAQAVELLVSEVSRLDRESGRLLLADVEPRQVYRGALTVMMRLVFMMYAEERALLPMDSELYRDSYSVTAMHDQLQKQRDLNGDQVTGLRAEAWPRLLASFAAIHDGCEHDLMRVPAYGGGLFDSARYPWLEQVPVSDLVTAEILRALLFIRRKGGAAERLSYKGLDVEQIGHVYEGLLEFSCKRADEPHLHLLGKHDQQVALSEIETQAARNPHDFRAWLSEKSGATPTQIRKALDEPKIDEATLDAACDNNHDLSKRIWPFRGLLRPDLRGNPTVFLEGSLFVTHDGDRRATGTHYTPRPLAEKIVRYTLEPLCYQTNPGTGERMVRSADELLELKVLDPAMGSGAFLVSACRYLAERLVEAWDQGPEYPEDVLDRLPADYDREDALLEASRRVAARCLYGVDRDEAAVDLGKLSLWIATLSKEQPFSFLDHALRWGDSLVGLTTDEQVKAFHLVPKDGRILHGDLFTNILEEIETKIVKIANIRAGIEQEPVRDSVMERRLDDELRKADALIAKLRISGDAIAAAALSTADQNSSMFDQRLIGLANEVKSILEDEAEESPVEQAFRERLKPWLQGDRKEPVRPFHWPLEFPEVMANGGFSAVVSNPPFMGGSHLRDRIGIDVREYLVNHVAEGTRGNADLCAYFLLRDLSLAKQGRVGIIATNTIAQGDTREVGLDRATGDMQWTIYRANKSQPWPGTASLEVSLIWLGHIGPDEECILDDVPVPGTTPSLDPRSRVTGKPFRLESNKDKSFKGVYLCGTGFILTPKEAEAMIRADEKNKDVLSPYLNGEDLNTELDASATRWVINFGDMNDMEASQFQLPWKRISERVKAERQEIKYSKRVREYWWQYERSRPRLYKAISNLDRVLVIAQTSRTQVPTLVPRDQVFDQKLVVFPTSSTSELAFRTSAFQYWWTVAKSSSMKTDTVYAPSDCCETLPCPKSTQRMTVAGETLDTFRPGVMKHFNVGLTPLYDIVGDEKNHSPDIVRLREIHVEIDEAVREAYALDEENEPAIREYEARHASEPLPLWREIDLMHGFYQTPQGPRFTVSPQARTDILDKLLALNHYRHQQEQPKASRAARANSAGRKPAAPPINDGLFPPPDALF